MKAHAKLVGVLLVFVLAIWGCSISTRQEPETPPPANPQENFTPSEPEVEGEELTEKEIITEIVIVKEYILVEEGVLVSPLDWNLTEYERGSWGTIQVNLTERPYFLEEDFLSLYIIILNSSNQGPNFHRLTLTHNLTNPVEIHELLIPFFFRGGPPKSVILTLTNTKGEQFQEELELGRWSEPLKGWSEYSLIQQAKISVTLPESFGATQSMRLSFSFIGDDHIYLGAITGTQTVVDEVLPEEREPSETQNRNLLELAKPESWDSYDLIGPPGKLILEEERSEGESLSHLHVIVTSEDNEGRGQWIMLTSRLETPVKVRRVRIPLLLAEYEDFGRPISIYVGSTREGERSLEYELTPETLEGFPRGEWVIVDLEIPEDFGPIRYIGFFFRTSNLELHLGTLTNGAADYTIKPSLP